MDNQILTKINEKYIKSLNGVRNAEGILNLVSNKINF